MAIGAFQQVLPVISKSVEPIIPGPEAPDDPDVGLRWGQTSQFKFSSIDPPNDDGGGFSVRGEEEHRFKTIVEEFPAATRWKTGSYQQLVVTDSFLGDIWIPASGFWIESWALLSEDDEKEIIRVVIDSAGNVTEHYQRFKTKYVLHLDFHYSEDLPFASYTDTYTQGEMP